MALSRDRDSAHSPFSTIMRRARSGRYGDVRMLGLCVGIVLFCVLGLVLTPRKAHETMHPRSPDLTATGQTSGQTFSQGAVQEDSFDSENVEDFLREQRTPVGAEIPKPPNADEKEHALREMAEQMPEGQVIVY